MHNVSAGVIVGDATLALQAVKRHRSGRYECEASNVEGDAKSNGVSINIKCEYDSKSKLCSCLFF